MYRNNIHRKMPWKIFIVGAITEKRIKLSLKWNLNQLLDRGAKRWEVSEEMARLVPPFTPFGDEN